MMMNVDDDDIYIMMECLSVTKNHHFLLPSWAPEAQSTPPAKFWPSDEDDEDDDDDDEEEEEEEKE